MESQNYTYYDSETEKTAWDIYLINRDGEIIAKCYSEEHAALIVEALNQRGE